MTSAQQNPLSTLEGSSVLVVGGARTLGAAISRTAADRGARVVVGARDLAAADRLAGELPDARGIRIDLDDESTLSAAAAELGSIDHIVSTGSAAHNVPVDQLVLANIVKAFQAKVFGPMLVAKHFAGRIRRSLTLFSGVAAWKPEAGYCVMDTSNGAVSFLVSQLAVELAPVRVNAISPGITDSGTWDGMGADKQAFLDSVARANPVGRVGRTDDIVDGAMWLLGAGFVSGETIHIEGGARWA